MTHLAVRVGDRTITRRAEDLTYSRSLHGDATLRLRLRESITRQQFAAFEKVWVYDAGANVQWHGRLEDPGRSVDGDGQLWDMAAVGEKARASDRTAPLVYIDRDLSRWIREQFSRATSATATPSDLPSSTGTDCLLMQYVPGEAIDNTATILMAYRAIEEAGMAVGGIEYTVVNGLTTTNFENRLFAIPASGSGTLLRQNTWSTSPTSRYATLSDATPLPTGTVAVSLSTPRTGTATTIGGGDDAWAGFYTIAIKAARLKLDGTVNTTNEDYWAGRNVYPHEVLIDVLARLLADAYEVPKAVIDTSSTYPLDQFAFPDGITAAQIFDELMALLPDFYWRVGPPDPVSGKPTFTWRKWPTTVRYEFTMADGLDLPGNDAERFNEVVVRWKDKRERIQTTRYEAGTTMGGIAVPTVAALDAQNLTRTGYLDLSDEMGSQTNADKAAAEFLLEHGTPPTAATLTVARRIWDNDLGRLIEPYEIMPGHLGRIRELADSASDLTATDRDGKSVFRVMGMEYNHTSRLARVELDAPPKTDVQDLATLMSRRERRR